MGLEALFAAVILAAVRDACRTGECKEEALEFLRSPWCGEILDFLELPGSSQLLKRIRAGVPKEFMVDLGTDPTASSRRAGAPKIDVAVQHSILVW